MKAPFVDRARLRQLLFMTCVPRRYWLVAVVFFFAASAMAASAEDVVRGFYGAWQASDVAGAMRYWSAAADGKTLRRTRRVVAIRCVEIEDLRIDTSCDERSCTAAASMQMTRWSGMPGTIPASSPVKEVFALVREDDGWKIADRYPVEEKLANAIADEETTLDAHRDEWTPELARQLTTRAIAFINQDKVEQAEAMAAGARRVAEEIGDARAYALALSVESILARNRFIADLPRSITLAAHALDIAERTGDADVLAATLLRYGRAAVKAEDPNQAPFRRAIELEPWLEDATPAAMASTSLTSHYDVLSQMQDSLLQSLETTRLAALTSDDGAIISAEMTLAGVYLASGDGALAAVHYDRAHTLAHINHFSAVEASLVTSLVLARGMTGAPPAQLIPELNAALEIPNLNRSDVMAALLSLRCRLRAEVGDLAGAESDFYGAVSFAAVSEKPFVSHIAEDYSESLLKQRRYEDVIAIGIAFSRGDDIARALARLDRIDEAIQAAQCAVEEDERQFDGLSDALRYRKMLKEDRYENYRILAALYVDQKQAGTALSVAEDGKARVLVNEVRSATPAASAEERRIESRVDALNRRLITTTDEHDAALLRGQLKEVRLELLDAQMRRSSTAPLARMRAMEAPLTWTDPEGAAIEYVTERSRTLIFVARGSSITARVVPIERAALESLVDEHSERMAARDLRYTATARRLYDLLIAPVAPLVAGARSICIVPDGQLWRVPFQTLQASDGRLLVERFAVAYAPSIRFANARRREGAVRHDRPRLLALGNPTISARTDARVRSFFRNAPLASLTEAEAEVKTIGRLYGSRSAVYVREVARESLLKGDAARYDIVHLAAHGLLDTAQPLFSAVVLTADEKDDGLLEAREIAAMNLPQPIVVLSACESASGTVRSGEGAIGLAWAFLAAGARVAVGTQWRTPSAAAEKLMTAFHRHLLAGDSVAEALRAAQLELRRNPRYRHPFYWAPFVAVGAP